MDPKGRIAVVTGAAGGIGGALVRALVAAGADTVVATDVRADAIAGGEHIVAKALDVGDEAATIALVHEVEDAHGPIDLWFANAGVAHGGGADAPDDVVGPAVERQRDGPRLRGARPAAGVDRPRRGPPRHDGVDGRHPHVARRRRLRGHQARRPRVRRVAGDHPRRAGRQGLLRLPRRRRHADADRAPPPATRPRPRRSSAAATCCRRTRRRPASWPPSRDDVFFIYTHPELKLYVERKAADPDRWIRGMARLWDRSQHLLAD